MITQKGLERLLQWAKYEARTDEDLYDMALVVGETRVPITEKEVSQFIGMIDAGSIDEYIATINGNTRREEDDNNERFQE